MSALLPLNRKVPLRSPRLLRPHTTRPLRALRTTLRPRLRHIDAKSSTELRRILERRFLLGDGTGAFDAAADSADEGGVVADAGGVHGALGGEGGDAGGL